MRVLPFSVLAVALCLPMAATGADNALTLIQESPPGSQIGNTLTIDMSGAQQARVGGVPTDLVLTGPASALLASDLPLLQHGEGNTGSVTLTGTGGTALLTQQGAGGGFGFGNDATIQVSGASALGAIEQTGNGNSGHVKVSGSSASGTLVQRGNNNSLTFEAAASGTTIIYQQIGNNITSVAPAQVISNVGGTILVTQSSF